MAYTDIISLSEAKIYLRIDDTLTEDDNGIIRMINAAFQYIEKYTNVIVDARDIVYDIDCGKARIYDYPINTDLSTLTDYTVQKKSLYYSVLKDDGETAELTLNVGFTYPYEVSYDLKEVAFEMIDLYYYGEKDGKPIDKKLSQMSIDTLNLNKRFLI